MSESRSFASLEPTLLARKGGAKPAMRPQAAIAAAAQAIEDLGWNDMGEAEEAVHEAEVVAIKGRSAVRQQIDAIAAHLARSEDSGPARKPAPEPEPSRRAAFTLRLDAQRHLKLRLASTIKNRSAQQIVTEALDRLLNGMPELDSLAAQLKKKR